MKRLFSVFLSITILVTMLSAFTSCKKEEEGFDFGLDPNEEVDLTIVGGLENFEGLEAVITKFEEKYTNCTITYVQLNDYENNLEMRMQNEGTTTQMFLSLSTNVEKSDVLRDLAVDFNDYDNVGVDISATNPSLTNSQVIDGKLYSIPLASSPRGMVVNSTLLAEKNVTIPTNWSEFLSACETFKQAGFIPIQCQNDYAGIGLMYSYYANTIVHSPDYETIFEEMNTYTEGSYACIEDFLNRVYTLVENDYIVYEETADFENNYEDAILNFFEGDVPFMPCTAETVSGMEKRETMSEAYIANPFDYEFVAVPAGDDGAYCYWQVWQGISVNKNAEHENWARAFVNFLMKEENLSLLASIKGLPSNTKSQTDDLRFASLYQIPDDFVATTDNFQITYYSILNNTFKKIVKSKDDPERMNPEQAMAYFEGKIAEKRAEEASAE